MSKKAILGALLVSSALLGTASANAATSSLHDESKLVTVEKNGAKVYKNSKLQESKKAKKGTVYKVDGYRDINNKKYYRVYQQDSKNKTVYRGYLLDKDAKDLKAKKVAKKDRFVGLDENDQTAWKNLYFNCKIKNYNGKGHSSNFEAKYSYEINGKKYFSLYRNNEWMGYMDASAFKVLKPAAVEEGKQAYKVVKEWNTYNDLFFTDKGTLKEGEKVTVKRIYTFETGRKYGSLYNAEGKWIGYANMNALEEDKAVDEETQKAIDVANEAIKKAEEILSKAQASKESKEAAQKVIDAAKETVKNGNLEDIKKVPSQIEEAIKALKPGATTIDVQRVQEAVKAGEEALKTVESQGIGSQDKERVQALKDAIENGKKVIADMKKGDASTEDADKAIQAIEDAINELGASATSVSLEELRNTIRDAEHLYRATANAAVTGRDELAKEIKAAKDLLASAKDGKVTSKQFTDEIKKLVDAMNNVKFDKKALLDEVTAVQKLASEVYMTKEGEEKFAKAMTDIMNLDANGGNYDKFLEAKSVLAEAKAGLEAQPNKADAEALIAAMNDVKALGKLPNQGKDLVNVEEVGGPYSEAVRIMEALEQDQANDNKATQKITKAQVEKATKAIKDALANVKFNEDTTDQVQAIGQAAEKAIKVLNSADQKAANEKLNAFNEAVKSGNPVAIAKATDELVNTINDAQNKELQAQITEAEAIIAKGGDKYTERSFQALQDAVAQGKEALKVPVKDITADTMNDKQSCTIAIKAAIKGLQPAQPKA